MSKRKRFPLEMRDSQKERRDILRQERELREREEKRNTVAFVKAEKEILELLVEEKETLEFIEKDRDTPEKIDQAMKQLEKMKVDTETVVEQQKASYRSLRDMVQEISNAKDLQAHTFDVIETTKIHILDNIYKFQTCWSLDEALNYYNNLLFLSRRFIPNEMFDKGDRYRKHVQKNLESWLHEFVLKSRQKGLTVKGFFPRWLMLGLYNYFYDLYTILLNIRLITESDVRSYYEDFVVSMKEPPEKTDD